MSIVPNTPGIYNNLPIEQYHASDGISKTKLDVLAKSPLHYWHQYLNPKKIPVIPSKALRLGSAIHCAILEPDLFEKRYVQQPDINRRTKAGKQAFETFQQEHTNKILLVDEEWQVVQSCKAAILNHPVAVHYLTGGISEQSLYWMDSETDLLCKCRPDHHKKGILADLKTTDNASIKGFQQSIAHYRYFLSATMTSAGYEECFNEPPQAFVYVAVETKAPFAMATYIADDAQITLGRQWLQYHLDTLKDCMAQDHWPSYTESSQSISLPTWASRAFKLAS